MNPRNRLLAAVIFGTVLGQNAARAQLASDDVPHQRIIPEQEQVDADLKRSRLRLGPIRLIPGFSIDNAGYDNNVFGTSEAPVGDWTFTARAGVRALLPLGSKMYLRADAFPQYTWWDKLAERRSFGGVANASVLGFFNRMTLLLSGSGSQDFTLYSTELLARVLTKTVTGVAAVEVQVTQPFSIFGKGEVQQVRYDPQGQLPVFDVEVNDRTEGSARGGVRYRFSKTWNVSTAFEQTWSDFDQSPETRNNESRAYLVGVHYARPTFYFDLSGGYREGNPRDFSSFPAYSTPTGSFFASYFPRRWLELQVYGRRRVTYSLSDFNPYYFANQIGGGVNIQPIPRLLLRGFAETGPNQYPQAELVNGVPVNRRDETQLYGGGLSLLLARPLVLTGIVTRSRTNSNIPSNDRAVTRYSVAVSFSGELSR